MGNFLTTCPACSESRSKPNDRCLSTNDETGAYMCHHCGITGIKKLDGTMKASKKEPMPNIDEYAPTEKLFDYFLSRGIPREVVIRNQIGYNGKEIMFPYLKRGKLVNVKYRSNDKKFRQTTGGEKIFFGLDDINSVDLSEVFIVEGEFDKLAFEVAGYKNVISVPDGAPALNAKNYESKFSYLDNCFDELQYFTKIIIAVDNDAPGRKLESELIRRLGPERCWKIEFDEKSKDANGTLITYGEAEIDAAVMRAKPCPIDGTFYANEFAKEYDALYDEGLKGGFSTSWPSLDEQFTVKPGQMTLITGIPQHGKSEFLDAMIINIAKEQGWRFAFFSPENHPVQVHMSKLARKYIGKPFESKQYGSLNEQGIRMTKGESIQAREWLQANVVFIAAKVDTFTIHDVIARAKAMVMRMGIRGLIIDPWNELDHTRSGGLTETEHISLCLTAIRQFAREHDVHVFVVAHPAKMRKENGKYPVPTPYDISGSAHFANKADNCLTIFRTLGDPERITRVYVQKVRFRECGHAGGEPIELKYNIYSSGFDDMQGTYKTVEYQADDTETWHDRA